VKFPGPEGLLKKGDRLFMLGGICNDPQRRTGPLPKSEDVAKMMDPEKFFHHIRHVTGVLGRDHSANSGEVKSKTGTLRHLS